MVKKGDTLIEVMLAVGIFSMIAISVVAVMSGGTSSAQTALETTLAREEIDAQAEALRYIHDSYINDKNSERTDLATVTLWKQITDNAYYPNKHNDTENAAVMQYAPTACPTKTSELPSGAFILDTRSLSDGATAYKSLTGSGSSFFGATATYPRLIFGADSGSLVETGATAKLTRAEGIYIIAVADKDTTTVLDIDGQKVTKDSPAFYDFYIRTCWYGSDADTPSTISTIIRLYNPDVETQYYKYSHVVYDEDGNIIGQDGYRYESTDLDDRSSYIDQPGWDFLGWCTVKIDLGQDCKSQGGEIVPAGKFYDTTEDGKHYDFSPTWVQVQYTINYDLNSGSWNTNNPAKPTTQKCLVGWGEKSKTCTITMPSTDDDFTRSGYEFKGWCDGQVDDSSGTCNGTTYPAGSNNTVTAPFPDNKTTINLKAIWRESNRIITIRADWTSNTDYDSMMELSAPGTENVYKYASYYTDNIMVEYHNQRYSLVTGAGDGRGHTSGSTPYTNHYENFTINTLGGKYYYYSIRRFNSGDVGSDVTVKITITNPENNTSTTTTYYSKNKGCSGNIWNVFGYVNGKIVTRNTCSDYDYSYTTSGYGMEYDYGK